MGQVHAEANACRGSQSPGLGTSRCGEGAPCSKNCPFPSSAPPRHLSPNLVGPGHSHYPAQQPQTTTHGTLPVSPLPVFLIKALLKQSPFIPVHIV